MMHADHLPATIVPPGLPNPFTDALEHATHSHYTNRMAERSSKPKRNSSPNSQLRNIFVGRQREMAELTAALDAALSGQGRLVMLVGEPGIGKTRTA